MSWVGLLKYFDGSLVSQNFGIQRILICKKDGWKSFANILYIHTFIDFGITKLSANARIYLAKINILR